MRINGSKRAAPGSSSGWSASQSALALSMRSLTWKRKSRFVRLTQKREVR